MPVAFEMRFKGATLSQYDQVIDLMGFTRGGKGPPAALFHWVTETDDGLMVVDVWENAEAYNRFAEEQIGPYTAQVGVEGPPEIRSYEVHNYLTAG